MPLETGEERDSPGQTHFKVWDDFALKGHCFSFSRVLSMLLLFAVQNPNAFALARLPGPTHINFLEGHFGKLDCLQNQ